MTQIPTSYRVQVPQGAFDSYPSTLFMYNMNEIANFAKLHPLKELHDVRIVCTNFHPCHPMTSTFGFYPCQTFTIGKLCLKNQGVTFYPIQAIIVGQDLRPIMEACLDVFKGSGPNEMIATFGTPFELKTAPDSSPLPNDEVVVTKIESIPKNEHVDTDKDSDEDEEDQKELEDLCVGDLKFKPYKYFDGVYYVVKLKALVRWIKSHPAADNVLKEIKDHIRNYQIVGSGARVVLTDALDMEGYRGTLNHLQYIGPRIPCDWIPDAAEIGFQMKDVEGRLRKIETTKH